MAQRIRQAGVVALVVAVAVLSITVINLHTQMRDLERSTEQAGADAIGGLRADLRAAEATTEGHASRLAGLIEKLATNLGDLRSDVEDMESEVVRLGDDISCVDMRVTQVGSEFYSGFSLSCR